ncbi:MAG: hypothetical protein WHS38_04120 [Thermodesulforhabdaceae bacterium]
MPVTLPLDIYEVFEKIFGKEDAKTVIKSLESVIGNEITNKWHQTKEELKTELLREVPTKLELENVKIQLTGEIEKVKIELLGKIETEITRLDRKFTIMFVILFFTIIFLNQNALEFLAKAIGLVK